MRKYYVSTLLIALLGLGSFFVYYVVSKDKIADQQTLSDMEQLHQKITAYTERNRALPSSLTDLDLLQLKVASRLGRFTYKTLPNSSEGDYMYQLCGDFKTDKRGDGYNYPDGETYISTSSGHQKGQNCFKLKVYAPPSEKYRG